MKNRTDQEILEQNAHILTEEILQDIADTQSEIATMKIEAEHLAKTPLSMQSARWDHMRAESRLSGIKEREEFIGKLEHLLKLRENILGSKEKEL